MFITVPEKKVQVEADWDLAREDIFNLDKLRMQLGICLAQRSSGGRGCSSRGLSRIHGPLTSGWRGNRGGGDWR